VLHIEAKSLETAADAVARHLVADPGAAGAALVHVHWGEGDGCD